MSQIIIEDAGWKAIMADPQLARARTRLSFHEIRLIVKHARASAIEAGRAKTTGSSCESAVAKPDARNQSNPMTQQDKRS